VDGQRKALIVATDDYEPAGWGQLTAPGANASALARVLADPHIGNFDVQVLRNEPAHVIEEQVRILLTDNRPDDVVLLYISGHAIAGESGKLLFATRNTDPSKLATGEVTGVSADFLHDRLQDSGSARIVVLLDCWYSGGSGPDPKLRQSLDAIVADLSAGQHPGRGPGAALIAASNPTDYRFEEDFLTDRSPRTSPFTSAIVDGLASGAADRDRDGWVSLTELYDHVVDRVREQHGSAPTIIGAGLEGEVRLALSDWSGPTRAGGPAPPAPPVESAAAAAAQPSSPLVDPDVQFSVYRPSALPSGRWSDLLVYAHKSDPFVDPTRVGLVDPIAEVERRARAFFDDTDIRSVRGDALRPLTRGMEICVEPDLPGVTCNPAAARIAWLEPIHEIHFRILAGTELVGRRVAGWVRVWCGPVILGEVPITLTVVEAGAAGRSQTVDHVLRYRKIFPSYAHEDGAVVEPFWRAAQAIGDQYLQDVLTLRSGEPWSERLSQLIEDADVFQLFWSSRSMRSPHCRREWEEALALRRPSFVRPVYWEEPFPEAPHLDLPPADLRILHFARVPIAATSPWPAQSAPLQDPWAIPPAQSAPRQDPWAIPPAPGAVPRQDPSAIPPAPGAVPASRSDRSARGFVLLLVFAVVIALGVIIAWRLAR